MPAFQYKAMDTQGKSHQGILEADSARLIRQQLRDKNLLPVEVSPCLLYTSPRPRDS